jgi:hypothetical protein
MLAIQQTLQSPPLSTNPGVLAIARQGAEAYTDPLLDAMGEGIYACFAWEGKRTDLTGARALKSNRTVNRTGRNSTFF